eukprot:scaffold2632_cov136-Skeletonema_dohrnii-CCMP3373.AAC.9
MSLKLSSSSMDNDNDNSNPDPVTREAGFGGHRQQSATLPLLVEIKTLITCGLATLLLFMFLIQMKDVLDTSK